MVIQAASRGRVPALLLLQSRGYPLNCPGSADAAALSNSRETLNLILSSGGAFEDLRLGTKLAKRVAWRTYLDLIRLSPAHLDLERELIVFAHHEVSLPLFGWLFREGTQIKVDWNSVRSAALSASNQWLLRFLEQRGL